MRVVAGRHRGRALQAPPGDRLRPTADRVRESVFNILSHGEFVTLLRDANVLDVFAGTGAMGIEALSRGARHATFIERDPQALAALRANLRAFNEAAHATVLMADALQPPRPTEKVSVAFLDPPYREGLGPQALVALRDWFAPGAVVTVEVAAREPFAAPDGFEILDGRRYGAARVIILRTSP
jgi:16S rRNA (guanine966-N2)-methyltransferase